MFNLKYGLAFVVCLFLAILNPVNASLIDSDALANYTVFINMTITLVDHNSTSPVFFTAVAPFGEVIANAQTDNVETIIQYAAVPANLIANDWNVLSALVVSTPGLNLSAIPNFVYLSTYALNFSIEYDVLSLTYDAVTCASNAWQSRDLYLTPNVELSREFNLIIVNGTNNCLATDQTAMSPCSFDSDCVSGLVCVSFWITFEAFPPTVCMPENATAPITTLNMSFPVSLVDIDPVANLAAVQAAINLQIANFYDEESSTCVYNYSISTNDTAFESNSTIQISMLAWNISLDCQFDFLGFLGPATSGFTTVRPECINDMSAVAGVLAPYVSTIPASVNSASNCGLNNQGLAPCARSTDCADGYQCGVLDVFNMPDVLACQYDLRSNVVLYNITATPTEENPHPGNQTANLIYILTVIDQLKQELDDNSCLALDSAQATYIPAVAPYQNAVLIATHVNMTTDACKNIDLDAAASAFMTAASTMQLYDVSVTTTQVNDVAVADCVSDDGAVVLAGSCSATASANGEQVSSCSSNSDCSKNYGCVEVATGTKVCLHDNAAASSFVISSVVMIIVANVLFFMV